ncbi:MAG: c-type cytochrome [Acidobacteriota bacterium]
MQQPSRPNAQKGLTVTFFRRLLILVVFSPRLVWAQAGPTERQVVDQAAVVRGRAVYTQYCINCHGALAKGADAPDLIRSALVLRDRLGNEIGPALRRLPGHKGDLTNPQVVDLTHFLKDQVEKTAKNRNPERPPNVLTGNVDAGRAYFNGAGRCSTCHSATGDLKGISARIKDPVDLQQRFLFPRRTKPTLATVTPAQGAAITGELMRIDDFNISLRDTGGEYHAWTRTPSLKVEVTDPLAEHTRLLDQYTDKDMHDIVRYLETLK